jgi:hypothetical protein
MIRHGYGKSEITVDAVSYELLFGSCRKPPGFVNLHDRSGEDSLFWFPLHHRLEMSRFSLQTPGCDFATSWRAEEQPTRRNIESTRSSTRETFSRTHKLQHCFLLLFRSGDAQEANKRTQPDIDILADASFFMNLLLKISQT